MVSMAAKKRVKKFSAVKAVKANARTRVGQPKPERIIDDAARARRSDKPKHKTTLANLLDSGEDL